MRTVKFFLVLLSVCALLYGSDVRAQSEARARYEWMKMIQKEKLNLVLPGAMRDHDIDMWIHVATEGLPDILAHDIGAYPHWSVTDTLNFFIFTDRGGDRIERAVLGGSGDRELYDIFGHEADLGEFVAERDPDRIAIEISDWLPASNSLQYTAYHRMMKFLGEKYADRVVSAERFMMDFRVRRVQSEVLAYGHMAEIQRRIMEEAYRRIVPNVTTREDLGWWVQDQLMEHNLITVSRGPSAPGVTQSGVPREEHGDVYRRGDFLGWDFGITYLNFGTDYKRYGYILKEDEVDVPAGLKKAWERAQIARDILRKAIYVGQTGGETLEKMVSGLEDADYIYTPFTDIGSLDRVLVSAIGDSEQSGVSVDCHPVGNNGRSEFAVGASMAPFRPYRRQFTIQENHLFSLEFMVHTWVPEWSRVLSINLEDNSVVTNKGVEPLYPFNEEIIIIH